MINGRDFRVSEGLPPTLIAACSQLFNYSEAVFQPKTVQNAEDVVQKSISQVSETTTKGQTPNMGGEGPKTKAQRPKTKAQTLKIKAQTQSSSGPRIL